MHEIYVCLLVALFFVGCSGTEEYNIQGYLQQENEGTIYLQKRIDKDFVSVDSCEIVEGAFSFEGKVDVVEEYYLSLANNERIVLFLENTVIKIEADSLFKDAVVSGGDVQQVYNSYRDKYERLYGFMLGEYYKIRDIEDDSIRASKEAYVDSLYENVLMYQEVFIKENLSSPVAPFVLSQIQYGKKYDELNELFVLLDKSLSGTQTYNALAARVEDLRLVAIGQKAPDFTQNDVEGNPISFSDVYAENQLTLVDFWASWCGPCRAENPNVLAAFEKFNSKGFTVFGVSLDKGKEQWIKAIADDSLMWQHVSDLKGWGNEAAMKYAVNSIPANFLVDNNGIIVAQGLRGEDLHDKLNELLGD